MQCNRHKNSLGELKSENHTVFFFAFIIRNLQYFMFLYQNVLSPITEVGTFYRRPRKQTRPFYRLIQLYIEIFYFLSLRLVTTYHKVRIIYLEQEGM